MTDPREAEFLSYGMTPKVGDWETKDSGQRDTYESGMVRDKEAGKPRFDLLFPVGIPFAYQMLTRFASLMARGAEKYSERNWELAATEKELDRYKSSASRHLAQWISGEVDEDHAAATMFNLMAAETVKYKLRREETNGSSKGNRDKGSSREGCAGKARPCEEGDYCRAYE